jgi:hypothetical protein
LPPELTRREHQALGIDSPLSAPSTADVQEQELRRAEHTVKVLNEREFIKSRKASK